MIRRVRRRLAADQRGTALIEFAFVLPVLILLFVGGYHLSDAMACKRRVTIMARAIGDLTSQYRTLSGNELDTVMSASTQIMAPYSSTPAQVRVTQFTFESTAVVRVDWSRGRNTGSYATGRYLADSPIIPVAMRQPNMTFIFTQTWYTYDSGLSTYMTATSFSQNFWLLPRRSSSITLT